jgi:hypothetical protein
MIYQFSLCQRLNSHDIVLVPKKEKKEFWRTNPCPKPSRTCQCLCKHGGGRVHQRSETQFHMESLSYVRFEVKEFIPQIPMALEGPNMSSWNYSASTSISINC